MNLKEIIDDLIKKEARSEAFEIMSRANEKESNDFLKYYTQKSFNVCCLVIDQVKIRLVKEKLFLQKPGDHFGKSWDTDEFAE